MIVAIGRVRWMLPGTRGTSKGEKARATAKCKQHRFNVP